MLLVYPMEKEGGAGSQSNYHRELSKNHSRALAGVVGN